MAYKFIYIIFNITKKFETSGKKALGFKSAKLE